MNQHRLFEGDVSILSLQYRHVYVEVGYALTKSLIQLLETLCPPIKILIQGDITVVSEHLPKFENSINHSLLSLIASDSLGFQLRIFFKQVPNKRLLCLYLGTCINVFHFQKLLFDSPQQNLNQLFMAYLYACIFEKHGLCTSF